AWSFNHFTVLEAIDKDAAAGGKTIEFFPGQKFSPENPAKFDQSSTKEMRDAVKAKLKEKDITPIGFGVVGGLGKDEASARAVFEFCKDMNIGIVVAEPTETKEAYDIIEKLVKEFDIKMAIHNHPRRPTQPSYRYWDPEYVLSMVKDRDPRMGSCADIGHFVRSGIKPLDAIHLLKGRILDSHLKDLTEFGNPKAHDLPFGTGVSGIAEVLNEYASMGFYGPVDVEYEFHMEDNFAEVKQCLDFVKNFKATTTK
ncbi:MAG: L-xylulose 5-phosphate 3-epimerase, partial [Verrucomicrobiaceae bacterium]|nr:L-xylulose 5-phosphate 3-epimerase [Verrucomicrobiaceae bacterium]